MRATLQILFITALALLGTLGCDSSEESDVEESTFLTSFDTVYCDSLSDCGPGATCPDVGDVLDLTCTYDSSFARDCLDGTFTCDDSEGPGLEVVVLPAACDSVFNCGFTTTETTETTTTTGTTEPTR